MSTTEVLEPKPLLIGGEWMDDTPSYITSINPATGEVNYRVCAATEANIDAAVKSARRAYSESGWQKMLPHERSRLLHRVADGMMEQADVIARAQMLENGKVWKECKTQVSAGAATFRYFASACEVMESEIAPSRGNYLSMVTHEPYGVVAAITPWNSPITLTCNKVAAALAAGNAVVLKPSSITPVSGGLEIGRIALEAGVPPGILNVVPAVGGEVGDCLVNHPLVRMVSFTGGVEAGRRMAGLAAERMIPSIMELGGKSPHIVFADADLESAADAVVVAIFEGTGQSCAAGSRLFVERKILDRLLELILDRTRSLRVDLPDAADAQLGPLASVGQRDFVEKMVEIGRQEGAEVLIGGRRPDDPRLAGGSYYLPTVLMGMDNRSRVAQEEIFGPVLCVLPFEGEDDLVRQANDTVYGLSAGVWTADYRRAFRVARAVEAGTVWINTYKQISCSCPFGGFKQSGLGREKGLQAVRVYQQAKSIYLSMSEAFDGGFTIAK